MYNRTGAKAVSRAYYGTDNSIIIFLDDVNCTGEESHIAQCTKIGDWGLHDCSHREDAGVNCTFGRYSNIPPPQKKTQLFNCEKQLKSSFHATSNLLQRKFLLLCIFIVC